MKTSELRLNPLDWAVAQAAGITVYPSKTGKKWSSKRWMTKNYGEFNHRHGTPWWNPSWTWSQGGWIIQRERISIRSCGDDEWVADIRDGYFEQFDSRPLYAAMRCFVASRLGDEVELPDEVAEKY